MDRPTNSWPARALALLACVGAVSCATLTTGRTTVVLLPDEDDNVGAVSVATKASSQLLDQAFSATTVGSAAAAPSRAQSLGRERVEASYAELLKAQPSKPASFTLHFLLDRTVLTDDSKALLPALLEAVRARKPTEIIIFGHADASGSEERNFKLSAERAKVVAELLLRHEPTLERIDLQSFGDKAPLVPSRAAEPRNRRAEVVIL